MNRLLRTTAVALLTLLPLQGRPTVLAVGDDPPTVAPVAVSAVDDVGMTVADMERSLQFYTRVLAFEKLSEVEVAGRDYELLTGVFGARARVVRLRLGQERLELTEFLAPKGRAMPEDVRPNDRIFQHVAIIVRDMDDAYRRLRSAGVTHASSGPQRLPDWNMNAGGIRAFYFRDPDGHFLEVLQFPAGKGHPRWQDGSALFLGIDHTAVVVEDTRTSLQFYRDVLGMHVAGESENYDTEQEHLNGVFGARLRITTMRAPEGPGIELLEYLAPRDGRPSPPDLKANDIAHWQTTLRAQRPERAFDLAREHLFSLVSPVPVKPPRDLEFERGVLLRDPDGHGIRLTRLH